MISSRSRWLAAALCLAPASSDAASGQSPNGLYRADDGRRLVLFPAPPAPDLTAMLVLDSGEVRALFAVEGETDLYSFGPALAVPEPVQGSVTLERDAAGGVTKLVRQDGNAEPVPFARVDVRFEPVRFANGAVELAGTLVVPSGPGPFAAVVMLHGSEPEPREGNLGVALLLASEGFAALTFDKRGVGESGGGEWRAAFSEYAGDAMAGFERLRAHPAIDRARIGFWGHSQGAWVAALAASKTESAAFAVLECGGALDPVETTLWWSRRAFESRGQLSPEQIEAALTYRRQKFDVVAGKRTLAELAPLTEAARKQPWFHVITERLPDGPFWEPNVAYDPRPALEGLKHCPVLALYAEHDDATPTEPSVRAARAAFERSDNRRAAVHVIPAANHALLQTKTGKRMDDEMPTLERFAPEYAPLLIGWLKEATKR